MDFSLPENVTSTPAAPVALVGLDIDLKTGLGRHAELWKAFTSERSPDRVSLRFFAVPNLAFPAMKPRRTSYEWFIPKGILKTNWMSKHLRDLPAVVIVFFHLDWNDPDWNEKKMECAGRVASVRAALEGRTSTKLAVVLLQKELTAALPSTEDTVTSERAAGLCSACELSARSLFVLPLTTPNLSGFVVRLENAFNELAQNYYHQEIRAIKSHKDYLNKTTHLYLFVRHQFKIGFLNELKRDLHTAYKHYQQAYNLLMEVRATDTNIVEVKTVAGFINYKVCRLAFKLNLPRDAISQFRRHMDIFHAKVGAENLAFEHCAWQAEQCHTFAKIFNDAIQMGLPAILTQHPGLYYQQAARYAIQRRQLAEDLCSDVAEYPHPDPLANLDAMEFYGQRPWRPGKVAIEPPEMQVEGEGVKALQFMERHLTPNHSDVIVELLRKAIRQFQLFRSPRSESHLTVQMAEELTSAQKFVEALTLLRPVIKTYRQDGWTWLLKAVLSLALKCAYLVAAVDDYVFFALELALLSDSPADGRAECRRIAGNVCRLFGSPPKSPSAEPGLTSKSERAAVGEAAQKWRQLFACDPEKEVSIEMSPEITESNVLRVEVAFDGAGTFRVDESVRVAILVKNRAAPGDEPAVFPISAISIFTEDSGTAPRLSWEAQDDAETFEVCPGKTVKKAFDLTPEQNDVKSKIVIRKVALKLGRRMGFGATVCFNLPTSSPAFIDRNREFFPRAAPWPKPDETDGSSEVDLDQAPSMLSVIKVEQRKPLLEMTVATEAPVLVGEWFVISVELRNGEKETLTNVHACARLSDAGDPIIADTTRLTTDHEVPEPSTPQTPMNESFAFALPPVTKTCPKLDPDQKAAVKFYLRASTPGTRGVNVTTSYAVRSFTCELSEDLSLDTIEPFRVSSELLSCRRQMPLKNAFTDEPFLLLPHLESLSGHRLKVVDSWLEPRHPVRLVNEVRSQLAGCQLHRESVGKECFPLVVKRGELNSSCLDVQELPAGKYVVKWTRSDDSEVSAVSAFDVSTVKVCQSTLFATVALPPYGVVRTPLRLQYKLFNRTDKVQEFAVTMTPGDAFMFSGNKQVHVKILPDRHHELNYVLYPLVPGEAVAMPLLKLTSVRLAQLTEDLGATLQRLLPATITVLPKERCCADEERNDSAVAKHRFEVGRPLIIECKPLASFGKPNAAKT